MMFDKEHNNLTLSHQHHFIWGACRENSSVWAVKIYWILTCFLGFIKWQTKYRRNWRCACTSRFLFASH